MIGSPVVAPLEVVQRETADIDWASNEDVTNEDKSERRPSGGELFAEVLEMTSRRREQLLVCVGVKDSELVLWWCRRDVLAGPAVQPVRAAVVDDRRLVSDALHWYPCNPSLEQA